MQHTNTLIQINSIETNNQSKQIYKHNNTKHNAIKNTHTRCRLKKSKSKTNPIKPISLLSVLSKLLEKHCTLGEWLFGKVPTPPPCQRSSWAFFSLGNTAALARTLTSLWLTSNSQEIWGARRWTHSAVSFNRGTQGANGKHTRDNKFKSPRENGKIDIEVHTVFARVCVRACMRVCVCVDWEQQNCFILSALFPLE